MRWRGAIVGVGQLLTDRVITADALHTASFAQRVLDFGGHYVLAIKENQPLKARSRSGLQVHTARDPTGDGTRWTADRNP